MPSRRAAALAAATLLAATLLHGANGATAGAPDKPESPMEWRVSTGEAARRLHTAYPDTIMAAHEDHIVWRDGTIMPIAAEKPHAAGTDPILDSPDLRAIFQWTYEGGSRLPTTEAPPAGDPGRARPRRFFDKLYGRCADGEGREDLTDVGWVSGVPGPGSVRVTRRQGVAERIAAISEALSRLPSGIKTRFTVTGGGYHCRAIAGTARPSAHGYGIAVDIAVKDADYWRWSKPDAQGRRAYRNRIPAEIVAIFERHGFIWGGRWRHFDTMHFEYRPELTGLAPEPAPTAPGRAP